MTYFQLSLNTSTGSRRSIKINEPVNELTTEEIEAAIGQIIENDVFDPAKGSLTGLNELELVTVTKQTIM